MTAFEIGPVIGWMVGVIVISFLLLVLVYVWKQIIQQVKEVFGAPLQEQGRPPIQDSTPFCTSGQQDGYVRRDFQ